MWRGFSTRTKLPSVSPTRGLSSSLCRSTVAKFCTPQWGPGHAIERNSTSAADSPRYGSMPLPSGTGRWNSFPPRVRYGRFIRTPRKDCWWFECLCNINGQPTVSPANAQSRRLLVLPRDWVLGLWTTTNYSPASWAPTSSAWAILDLNHNSGCSL